MSAGLTRRMSEALDFIRAYQLEHGHCPSYPEIAVGIGMAAVSKGRTHAIILALEERGKIRRIPGKSRSIEVLPASPVLSLELPPDLYALVQRIARQSKVTKEAVVIEAVRDGFKALSFRARSQNVNGETSAPASQEMRARVPGPDTHHGGVRALTPRG